MTFKLSSLHDTVKLVAANISIASLTRINDAFKPIHTNKQSPKSGDLVEQIR